MHRLRVACALRARSVFQQQRSRQRDSSDVAAPLRAFAERVRLSWSRALRDAFAWQCRRPSRTRAHLPWNTYLLLRIEYANASRSEVASSRRRHVLGAVLRGMPALPEVRSKLTHPLNLAVQKVETKLYVMIVCTTLHIMSKTSWNGTNFLFYL